MSADLADLGHNYRSVNLQRPIPALSYLLETEIFSIVEYQLKCCSVADVSLMLTDYCVLIPLSAGH